MNECWVVIGLYPDVPKIIGVFDEKKAAEDVAYSDKKVWCNVFRVEKNKDLRKI